MKGQFNASARRFLFTKWVGQTWEEICQNRDMIVLSFQKTGIAVAVGEMRKERRERIEKGREDRDREKRERDKRELRCQFEEEEEHHHLKALRYQRHEFLTRFCSKALQQ